MIDSNVSLERLQSCLGYSFTNITLLEQALTHRSKHKNNNERLEFLGDALLETILSHILYHLRPQANEGDLTRLRSTMVRGTTLAMLAEDLNLKNFIRVGSGELRTGGYQRASTLADAFEAVVAAIYLDCNSFDTTFDVVRALYEKQLSELPEAQQLKDPKTLLQEWLQSQDKEKPVYSEISVTGPDHDRRFEVSCNVDEHTTLATKSSKKKAEQAAAEKLITILNIHKL